MIFSPGSSSAVLSHKLQDHQPTIYYTKDKYVVETKRSIYFIDCMLKIKEKPYRLSCVISYTNNELEFVVTNGNFEMVKSEKTGSYAFKEEIVENAKVKEFFANN